MVTQYACQVTTTYTTKDGWKTSIHSPTFYLHPDVQGIVNTDHAKEIALSMWAMFVPIEAKKGSVEYHVVAEKVVMLED